MSETDKPVKAKKQKQPSNLVALDLMAQEHPLAKLDARLRAEHGIGLDEAFNQILRRFGMGVNLRD